MKRILPLCLIVPAMLCGQEYTRGIGVYPGDPKDDFGPTLVTDGGTYRNLALRRPAYHSSSYDYNLTAQLVTDGIKDAAMPRWVSTATSNDGVLPKNHREWLLDGHPATAFYFKPAGWVQVELAGGAAPLEVDRVDLEAEVKSPGWTCVVKGSDDGQTWKDLGRVNGSLSVALDAPSRSRFYRVEFKAEGDTGWRVAEIRLFRNGRQLKVGGPYDFTSAWMSAGTGEEWVYVDLGAVCTFDRVALAWVRPAAEGAVQASNDAVNWKTLQPLSEGGDMRLAAPAQGRYVRVLMSRPAAGERYILSELEVYGRGGPVAKAKPAPAVRDGRLDLAGGAWKVQRASLVTAGGEALSKPGFADADWVVATVPGTVLSSYWNAGALADPNYGDNQLYISDSFFASDFWYRDEFVAPPAAPGRRFALNFDGINWKADVYLNGAKLGRIEGGFTRAQFDVTSLVRPGAQNALAVLIVKNATPGSVKEKTFEHPDFNGGPLGADNPTYHASIGWDWIPTIRGRNAGIWNDVYLTTSGPVTIQNPFVRTALPLPDTSRADVTIEATLRNHEPQPVSGTLRANFGSLNFEQPVTIEAGAEKKIAFNPQRLDNPKLWWPAGYGDPNLYPVKLEFVAASGAVSDAKAFQAGVRQFAYSVDGAALRMWINGKRFVPRGGNWGFGESNLRYRAREYDAAVRYHRDMNFTMIRNWVGQIGDDEFYEACDRYGIVVWQDFWLANPSDGPDPDDNALFLRNVRDTVLRIRNHASIGLYCGRNEGYPPKPLEDGIRQALGELHPGLYYIPSSADDVVSGHGPYAAQPLKKYFEPQKDVKFHSEMGMPNIVTLDSLRAMMPADQAWPQGRMWGIHDFSLNGAQGGKSFRERIEKSYGGADNLEDWVTLAQFANYEGYRAMFEAQNRARMGLLIWMSHPTWPSFVWQTYDYYFDTSAAYFGAKKASEPLHIQWNPVTEEIAVVNETGRAAAGLTARIEILNMTGERKWEKTVAADNPEDSTTVIATMEYPAGLTPVHFLRLKLTRGSETVSENFYWRGTEDGNFRALRELPKVKLDATTRAERQGARWLLTTELRNPAREPALMVRVKAVREKSGDRILPALYSDNYVALMPGESKVIRTELADADTRGEAPRVVVEGFNVAR
ncbi:MAG: glycosyl hydrolase 2 galactose-binding domain-containing protein [Acidobacteriota bacterium]